MADLQGDEITIDSTTGNPTRLPPQSPTKPPVAPGYMKDSKSA